MTPFWGEVATDLLKKKKKKKKVLILAYKYVTESRYMYIKNTTEKETNDAWLVCLSLDQAVGVYM